MTPLVKRLTSKGQFTLPRELRQRLGVGPGDYVALTPTDEGVLITAVEVGVKRQGEAILVELVREIGRHLEAQGITEEEQLDAAIETAKREAFERHYGQRPP